MVAAGLVPVTTVPGAVYGPLSLDLGATYYWRVDEVNDRAAPAKWSGEVWSFSTAPFITVDDFEGYTEQEGNRLYEAWRDGWDDPANGSVVGYTDAPFVEQVVVHGGRQAMPLSYDNTGGISSQATFTFAPGRNWTRHRITTLVLFVQGEKGNTGGPLYVKINNAKVVYNGGPAGLTESQWKQWNIDLAATGAALDNVTSLTIGVEGGGSGMLYFDDLRLYGPVPQTP